MIVPSIKLTALASAAALLMGLGVGGWLTSKSKAAELQRYETRIAQLGQQQAQERERYAKAVAEANAKALAETERMKKEIEHAQTQHAQRLAEANAAADAARTAAERLRGKLATTSLQLSQLSEQAVRGYAHAATTVLGECAATYQRVAADADRCVADLKLMQDAWPR
ncbi:MAG: hypothetical protein Q4A97_08455 [Comamonadaceae bacterium]|nr:hypothetical protein [Comamonadaceae bacterium]